MTTEPVDPPEPANDDANLDGSAGPHVESETDADSETDAMGINDDDPLDATLVGGPIDDDEDGK